MIKFSANFYFVNGRIQCFESTTGLGREKDVELEEQEKFITPLLEKMLKKEAKIDLKGFRWIDTSGKKPKAKNVKKVYFIEIEDVRWLDSKEFKGEVKFQIVESEHNNFTFKQAGKIAEREDAKELASDKNMDEEDYS